MVVIALWYIIMAAWFSGLYKSYLTSIRLPEKAVNFSAVDIKGLEKENYDSELERQLKEAEEITVDTLISEVDKLDTTKSYRVAYNDPRQFRRLASRFKLMMDIRVISFGESSL